jgi:hypothetical protein
MTTSNEEQGIRRRMGPAIYRETCAEFTGECARINANGKKFECREKRPGFEFAVRNLRTGHVLRLNYDATVPAISYECESESGVVTFQVNRLPAPSLVMLHDGTALRPLELAATLLQLIID